MAPAGLAERGSAFWADLTADRSWDAAGLVLVAEACRIVDRLEQLDRLLRRDISEWVVIVDEYASGRKEIRLEINDALSEARQQQGSLLQVLSKLGLGKSEAKTTGQGSRVDAFSARRPSRLAAAAAR